MAVSERDLAEYQDLYKRGEIAKANRLGGVIMQANGGLVNRIVTKYKPFLGTARTTDWEDLFQAGMIGLLVALKGYNPAKGAFSTYATFKILHEVQCAVRKDRLVGWPKNNGKAPAEYTEDVDGIDGGSYQDDDGPDSDAADAFFRGVQAREDYLPILCRIQNEEHRHAIISVCAGLSIRETAKTFGMRENDVHKAMGKFAEALEEHEREEGAGIS